MGRCRLVGQPPDTLRPEEFLTSAKWHLSLYDYHRYCSDILKEKNAICQNFNYFVHACLIWSDIPANVCGETRGNHWILVDVFHFPSLAIINHWGQRLTKQARLSDYLPEQPRDPLVSASPALDLQAHTTTSGFISFFFFWNGFWGSDLAPPPHSLDKYFRHRAGSSAWLLFLNKENE